MRQPSFGGPVTPPKYPVAEPNSLWTADFKGWWRTGDGDRCDAAAGDCVPSVYASSPTSPYAEPAAAGPALWYQIAAINACGVTR